MDNRLGCDDLVKNKTRRIQSHHFFSQTFPTFNNNEKFHESFKSVQKFKNSNTSVHKFDRINNINIQQNVNVHYSMFMKIHTYTERSCIRISK